MDRKVNLTDEQMEIIADQIDRIMVLREKICIIKTEVEARGKYEPGALDAYLISGALDDLLIHYETMLQYGDD